MRNGGACLGLSLHDIDGLFLLKDVFGVKP